METKGRAVYLMGIPSNTSCTLLMLTSSPVLNVVVVGAAGAVNAGVDG
jgi:purine-nucleoside phosphorylase